MNRRSFFGMFGALSAVTAAGIILPEPVKSYFFFHPCLPMFTVRRISLFDIMNNRHVNRIDIVRSDSRTFILELPYVGVNGRLMENVPQSQLASIIEEISSIKGMPFTVPKLEQQSTVSFLT